MKAHFVEETKTISLKSSLHPYVLPNGKEKGTETYMFSTHENQTLFVYREWI